jgi:two-component system, LuxR family, sensor kinase FixL
MRNSKAKLTRVSPRSQLATSVESRSAGISSTQQARIAAIVASSDDAIIAKSLDGTIVEWNPAAERLFGYSAAEAIGRWITLIVPQDRLAEEQNILNRIRRGKTIDHYETIRRAKNGRLVNVSVSVSPLRDERGRIAAASTIIRDITGRKAAEEALRDRERRLETIINTAADAIITIDEHALIDSINPATEKLFGYAAREIVGQNINRLMPEPFHGEHDGYVRNYCRTGSAKIIGIGREVTGLRKDGTTFPMHLSVSEVRLESRRLFTGIIHDLSGRRRLERQILEAAANEQRRIGQDLHDGLCQDLVGIAFSLDAAIYSLPPEAEAASKAFSKLAMSVREAAAQARDLSHGLNPVNLSAGGVVVGLENLAKKVSQSFRVNCAFRWDGKTNVRDDTIATHLYRIVQEAVSNAIKHGKANKIEVALSSDRNSMELAISDNGSGIPQKTIESVRKGFAMDALQSGKGLQGGIGLQTMHYRARVIGGTFAASARPGGGSVIRCILACDSIEPSASAPKRASGNSPRAKGGRSR